MKTTTLAKINNVTIQMVSSNNEKLIPIKPICEALGIQYPTQFNKLKEDDFLNSVIALRATTGSDGKQYEMVCLPIEFVFGWLFTINPKNVNPDARDAVSKYRIECYRALFRHFTSQSEFLEAKQSIINTKIELYEQIRTDFKAAEKRLKEAKSELFKAKDYTFEQWEFNNRQMILDFNECDN